jgi:hypothetical protein
VREHTTAAAPPSSVMNSRAASFDHLVGAGEERRRDRKLAIHFS